MPRTAERYVNALALSERRLLLLVADLVSVNGALLLTLALRPLARSALRLAGYKPTWFLLLSVLWLALAYTFDLYNLRLSARVSTAAPAVAKAGLLTAVTYELIPFLTPALPRSRLALVALPALLVAFLVTERVIYALVVRQPRFRRRTLIVGAGGAGQTIACALAEHGDGTYQLLGYVDDDPGKLGNDVEGTGQADPLVVLGDRYALPNLIVANQVSTLIVAITDQVSGPLLQALIDCLEYGVDIIPMPVLYEQLTGRVPVVHIGGNWTVAMPIDHPGTGALWPLAKRLLDVVLAALGLCCFALLLPFLAVAIYTDSPGPLFYAQERVGKGGRRFRVYKLRSMVVGAENGQAVWASKNDPRVTRVGRFLRRTHLDELPQFLNILKGEMSVVGPRPERPEFVERLAAEIPFYRVRHAVKPGAAGWGLIHQGYGASTDDALLKLQYDLYYIKHQSLWLDILILVRTVANMVTLRGR